MGGGPVNVGPGLESIYQCCADGVSVRRHIVGQKFLRLVQIRENHLVENIVGHCPRVILGLLLRGLLCHDRYAEPDNTVPVGIVVLLEFIKTDQIQIAVGPVGVCEAEILDVSRGNVRRVHSGNLADDVIAHCNPSVVCVPGQYAYGIFLTEGIVGAPLLEPVITYVSGYHEVTCHGFRGQMDGGETEVPGLTGGCVSGASRLHHCRRNTFYQCLQCHLVLGRNRHGMRFLDAGGRQ